MSHVIGVPAASQELFQMAFSPSIRTLSRFAAISRSRSFAVTVISLFSVKRRAVSFITAKASGSSSSSTSSICPNVFSSSLSISS